jgi:hypothetical protein
LAAVAAAAQRCNAGKRVESQQRDDPELAAAASAAAGGFFGFFVVIMHRQAMLMSLSLSPATALVNYNSKHWAFLVTIRD